MTTSPRARRRRDAARVSEALPAVQESASSGREANGLSDADPGGASARVSEKDGGTHSVAEGDDELFEFEYRPMPPKRRFSITVNLHVRGRGKPVPFQPPDDLSD